LIAAKMEKAVQMFWSSEWASSKWHAGYSLGCTKRIFSIGILALIEKCPGGIINGLEIELSTFPLL